MKIQHEPPLVMEDGEPAWEFDGAGCVVAVDDVEFDSSPVVTRNATGYDFRELSDDDADELVREMVERYGATEKKTTEQEERSR